MSSASRQYVVGERLSRLVLPPRQRKRSKVHLQRRLDQVHRGQEKKTHFNLVPGIKCYDLKFPLRNDSQMLSSM